MSLRIVIPSARASNLVPCVAALLRCEPTLAAAEILVVDDGARAEAPAALPVTWIAGVAPFVFAQNVNRGIAAAGDAEVILLNDDARLVTPDGFSRWGDAIRTWPRVGVCSAAIRGVVCNPRQRQGAGPGVRDEPSRLAFVCVYLPRDTRAAIGPFDERFTGYGFEDFDYCRRVTDAGRRLLIWEGCVVDHAGVTPSTYRTRHDIAALLAHNRRLYLDKWGPDPPLTVTGPG